jgi:hypothetical protein
MGAGARPVASRFMPGKRVTDGVRIGRAQALDGAGGAPCRLVSGNRPADALWARLVQVHAVLRLRDASRE